MTTADVVAVRACNSPNRDGTAHAVELPDVPTPFDACPFDHACLVCCSSNLVMASDAMRVLGEGSARAR